MDSDVLMLLSVIFPFQNNYFLEKFDELIGSINRLICGQW